MTALGTCPHTIRRPVMTQRWETLTFLHWAYDVATVQALLPTGLTVQPYDGRAWVGLVPFRMTVGPGPVASVPWLGRFLETNVRTYVVGPDGTPGVWYFSLDASRLAAVVAARSSYRLPYFWSRMSLERNGSSITYTCARHGSGGPRSSVEVEVGDVHEASELEHFLTARWRLYSAAPTGLRHADVEHEPWPLRRAVVTSWNDDLVRRAGLVVPHGAPLAHFSEGVRVKIGAPRRA